MKLKVNIDSILEAMPDCLIIINNKGEIVYVNTHVRAVFGYNPDELLEQPVEKLIPARFHVAHVKHRQHYFGHPQVRPMGAGLELYGLRKNGVEFPVEISLNTLKTKYGMFALAAIRDITQSKKIEEKFKSLFESMPDALIMINQEGKIILINSQTEKLFGFNRADLLNAPLEKLLPERYRHKHQFHRQQYFKNIRLRPMGLGLPLYGLTSDGKEFPVEISLSPLEVNNEMLALAAIRDVTERNLLEQNSRRKQVEFMNIMCHEIRNPLNAICGMINLMLDTLKHINETSLEKQDVIRKPLEELTNYVNILESCSLQLKFIVNDILDLSKLESDKTVLNPTVFSLKKVFAEFVRIHSPQISQKKLTLTINLPDEDISLIADVQRLSQIITNLLSNAIKFTPESGNILVTVSVENLSDNTCKFIVTVKDSGIGITEEEMPHLFQPFSQASTQISGQYGGSGLGLVICKKLVEKMQGTITVSSKKNHGTAFTFFIVAQRVAAEAKASESKATDEEITASNKQDEGVALPVLKHILIVEDNAFNQLILKRYLEKENYVCKLANNGLEAIEKYKQYQFDLICMDIEMPIMGGLEATKNIRDLERESNIQRQIPILGLSGNASKEQIETAKNSGMDDYLTKPILQAELYRVIDKLIKANPRSLTAQSANAPVKTSSNIASGKNVPLLNQFFFAPKATISSLNPFASVQLLIGQCKCKVSDFNGIVIISLVSLDYKVMSQLQQALKIAGIEHAYKTGQPRQINTLTPAVNSNANANYSICLTADEYKKLMGEPALEDLLTKELVSTNEQHLQKPSLTTI